MKKIQGGVTAPAGFLASSCAAGIKYKNREDMALVYSEVPACVAGVFTTNVVKAAPVKWDKEIVKTRETARAVILNSGIANACTGEEGKEINYFMADEAAKALNVEAEDVLTASTGVIGMQIPKDRLKEGVSLLVPALTDSLEGGHRAACAIMTTDTICKECAVEFEIGGKTVKLGAMTKGSGMIHPNMATMLCVITTDLAIEKSLLQEMVQEDVKDSFNMISVDRDTSTNDSMVALANGMAGNEKIVTKDDNYKKAAEAMAYVTQTLAKMMAGDGEGATKLFETKVIHAKDKESAVTLAKSVITSPLVKTAVYGNDANWGRILCAMGYSGEDFDPEVVDLTLVSEAGELKIVENGVATGYSEEKATEILSKEYVTCIADLKIGEGEAVAWGCDLTYDYVKINGDYRS